MVTDEKVSGAIEPLFAIRRGLARPRFLVAARKEKCDLCGCITRIVTTWATPKGVVERIAWCRYCFEAECGVVPPTTGEQADLARTLRAVEQRTPVTWFDCARLVAEELERRGML
jgi:hypothetical protein